MPPSPRLQPTSPAGLRPPKLAAGSASFNVCFLDFVRPLDLRQHLAAHVLQHEPQALDELSPRTSANDCWQRVSAQSGSGLREDKSLVTVARDRVAALHVPGKA